VTRCAALTAGAAVSAPTAKAEKIKSPDIAASAGDTAGISGIAVAADSAGAAAAARIGVSSIGTGLSGSPDPADTAISADPAVAQQLATAAPVTAGAAARPAVAPCAARADQTS